MAYAAGQTGSRKIGTIAAVGIIHAAIGAGLVYGLAPGLIDIIDPPGPLVATTYTLPDPVEDPIEPKSDQAETAQPQTPQTAPNARIDLSDSPITLPPTTLDLPPIDFPMPGGGDLVLPPPTPPKPGFDPVGAKPKNLSQGWVIPDDYPRRDLLKGNEGQATFRLVIGTNGKVQSCEIVSSTGFEGLDKATCTNVQRRAQFDAARDGNGEKVVGTYTGTIVWRIPE